MRRLHGEEENVVQKDLFGVPINRHRETPCSVVYSDLFCRSHPQISESASVIQTYLLNGGYECGVKESQDIESSQKGNRDTHARTRRPMLTVVDYLYQFLTYLGTTDESHGRMRWRAGSVLEHSGSFVARRGAFDLLSFSTSARLQSSLVRRRIFSAAALGKSSRDNLPIA